MSTEDVWVGVDVGTGGARALAVTGRGRTVGVGESPLASRRSPGRHEQDPHAWWDASCSALRAALASVPPRSVRGVAVDATSGTVVAVDDEMRPTSPGLMYDDVRAAAYVERVNERGAALWQAQGYQRMQPSWALPKVLWLLDHHPDARRGRIVHQTDLITSRLLGRCAATDLSSALKTGADLAATAWPADLLDDLGVPAGLLPDLVPCGDRLGEVGADAAAATGLPVGTPVYAGATDGYAGQLGAGALSPGSWSVVLGTTMVFKGVSQAPLADPDAVVYSHRGPGGLWFPGGASSTGAGALAAGFPGADLDALTRAATGREPAGSITYPLTGQGERFPFVAPQAHGFTLGRARDDADRFAAVLQGIAFIERLAFDSLDRLGARIDGRHVTTGGGSRNDYWTSLRADVTGRTVETLEHSSGALGMSVLAACEGAGSAERLTRTAAAMVRVRSTVVPDSARGEKLTASYLELVDALVQRGWVDDGLAAHARRRSST